MDVTGYQRGECCVECVVRLDRIRLKVIILECWGSTPIVEKMVENRLG